MLVLRLLRIVKGPLLWCVAAAVSVHGLSASAAAQPDDEGNKKLLANIKKEQLYKAASVCQVVWGNPGQALASVLTYKAQPWDIWGPAEIDDAPFESKWAPSLDVRFLPLLAKLDGKPVPVVTERKAPQAQAAFTYLFAQALLYAESIPLQAFVESAKDNEHIGHARLIAPGPKRDYGKVVAIEGRLLRVSKVEQAPYAAEQKGIEHYYQGWVSGPSPKSDPFLVYFMHLPEGVKVAEFSDHRKQAEVRFVGYFLGRYSYTGGDGKSRIAPLLVGPTLVVLGQAAGADGPGLSMLASIVIYGIVGAFVLAIVLMFVLNIWFRRGDQQVRERLAQLQAKRAVEALEGPLATPPEATPESAARAEANGFAARPEATPPQSGVQADGDGFGPPGDTPLGKGP